MYSKNCNQCRKGLNFYSEKRNVMVGYCTNPGCPSYAMLQVAREDMTEEFARTKTKAEIVVVSKR